MTRIWTFLSRTEVLLIAWPPSLHTSLLYLKILTEYLVLWQSDVFLGPSNRSGRGIKYLIPDIGSFQFPTRDQSPFISVLVLALGEHGAGWQGSVEDSVESDFFSLLTTSESRWDISVRRKLTNVLSWCVCRPVVLSLGLQRTQWFSFPSSFRTYLNVETRVIVRSFSLL